MLPKNFKQLEYLLLDEKSKYSDTPRYRKDLLIRKDELSLIYHHIIQSMLFQDGRDADRKEMFFYFREHNSQSIVKGFNTYINHFDNRMEFDEIYNFIYSTDIHLLEAEYDSSSNRIKVFIKERKHSHQSPFDKGIILFFWVPVIVLGFIYGLVLYN